MSFVAKDSFTNKIHKYNFREGYNIYWIIIVHFTECMMRMNVMLRKHLGDGVAIEVVEQNVEHCVDCQIPCFLCIAVKAEKFVQKCQQGFTELLK